MTTKTPYGTTVQLNTPFEAAVEATRAALAAEGFGILMEADLKATFLKKLGAEHTPYVILGACSPRDAFEALKLEPDLGLLLPCNVIVFEGARGDVTVSIANPRRMFELVATPGVEGMVEQVHAKLSRAAASLRS